MPIPNRGYNIRIVLVFDEGRGTLHAPESYLPRLRELAKERFPQADFYVNSTLVTSFQIGFTPIRSKYGPPNLAELVGFDNSVRQEFPEYAEMIFHNQEGHDWGREFG